MEKKDDINTRTKTYGKGKGNPIGTNFNGEGSRPENSIGVNSDILGERNQDTERDSERYIEKNRKSRGELNTDKSLKVETDNDGNEMKPKMVEYLSGSIGDRVNPYDPNSKHMVWF